MLTTRRLASLLILVLPLFAGCDWMKRKSTKETTVKTIAPVTPEEIFTHDETQMATVLPTDVRPRKLSQPS